MEERNKRLLRYVELAARDTRGGCDTDCQTEMVALRTALGLSHDEIVKVARELLTELM